MRIKCGYLFIFCCVKFAFLMSQTQEAEETPVFLPTTSPKVQKVEQIFQHIIKAASVSADPKLCVKVEKSKEGYYSIIGLAQFKQKENLIVIEEKVYDSCMIWGGENAIAYLLAHEFGHYLIYQEKGIGFPHSDTLMEADADLRGNLYARIAGYNPCNKFEYVLNNLYTRTKWIDDTSSNYPKRETRLRISENACIKSDSLAKLFHLGNELLVLQQYETAAVIFDYLSAQFPAPEMYFNAALARIGFAFEVENEVYYRLPLLFDARTGTDRAGDADNLFKKETYLEQAIALLSKAEKQGKNALYVSIYKEYVHHLQDEELTSVKELTGNEPLLLLLKGIALAKTDSAQAKQLFLQVAPIFPKEVEWNLNLLQAKGQPKKEKPYRNAQFEEEKIANKHISELSFDTKLPYWRVYSDDYLLNEMPLHLQFSENEHSIAYILQDSVTEKTIKILQTSVSYPYKSILGNVSLFQNYQEVSKSYDAIFPKDDKDAKSPKMEFQNLQKELILQYGSGSENGILFWFSEDKKLTKWVLYDIK